MTRDPVRQDTRDHLYPSEPPLGSDRDVEYRRHRSFVRRHAAPLVTLVVVLVVLVGGIAAVVATWDAGTPPPEAFSSAGVDAPLSASPGAGGAGASASPSAAGGSGAPTATGSSSRTVVLGTIVSVGNGTWVFRTDDNFTLTVVLTPTTKYGKNNNPAPFVAGVHARVIGALSNQVLTATSVARAAA